MRRETIAVHAGFDCDPTTKAVAAADLPDGRLRLRQRRPRRGAVQPGGRRLPLQPHLATPPPPCWRSGSPRWKAASRRCRWPPARPRCTTPWSTWPTIGRQHRRPAAALRHHPHAVRPHAAPAGHRGALRRQRRRRRHRAADRRRDPRGLLRERRQPGRQHLRHRGDRRGGAPPRRAADRRQHRGDADPAAPDRVRRRHRGALADQVHGRPWHHDGRRHRRWRPLRLDGQRRALPAVLRARRLLSRPRLRRALRRGRPTPRGCAASTSAPPARCWRR